jgi:BioD-like phosphotransacetylase family protein
VRGLTFLGTGPNSGKSTLAVGLIVLARQHGVAVTPFKPVAVVDLADTACPSPRLWEHPIHHHEAAAEVAHRWQHNPVTLVPDAPYAENPTSGRLYVRGEDRGVAGLLAEDTIDHTSLSPEQCRAIATAVDDAVAWHHRHSPVVVMEGSGALDQRPEDDDVVNRGPAAALGLPAVVMTKGWSEKHLEDLRRCIAAAGALRAEGTAPVLDHVVINGVDDPPAVATELTDLARSWGVRAGGVVETIRYASVEGTFPERAERHRVVADAVLRGLAPELLAHVLGERPPTSARDLAQDLAATARRAP